MNKTFEINNIEYELIKENNEGFDLEKIKEKHTDYFDTFDYIVGDWAYGKLRLKGFYENSNKVVKEHNNINKVDEYIKSNCAYNCGYFIIKRVYKKK